MRVVIRVLYAYCQSYDGFQSGQLTKHGTTGHHSDFEFQNCICERACTCLFSIHLSQFAVRS